MPKLLFKDHSHSWRTGQDFPDIPLTKVSWDTAPDRAIAWVYFGHVNIDYDGSSTAYAPDDHVPIADDDLGNAWSEENGWFGVFALPADDPLVLNQTVQIDKKAALLHRGKYPVIQQAKNGDLHPGYYVSTTPQAMGPQYMQSSYLDAGEISFGALSGKLGELGVILGDYALAVRHDVNLQSPFYFADAGSDNHALGECSHKVGKNLGGTGRGKYFNNNYPVSFLVFPGSGDMDPLGIASMDDPALKKVVQPLLVALSQATNPEDLPLLMGFNEVEPTNRPKGTSKLADFHAHPASPRPKNYATILQGLRTFGYNFTLAAAAASGAAAAGPVPTSGAAKPGTP